MGYPQNIMDYYYPVARLQDLEAATMEGKPLAAVLLGKPLVIYKIQGEVVVADDRCPHRGEMLSAGAVSEAGLQCPYHGLQFAHLGACARIPAHPQVQNLKRFDLRSYPVVEFHGLLWTNLGAGAFYDLELGGAGESQRLVVAPPVNVNASAGRQVEGFMDISHLPFVHRATFSECSAEAMPAYNVEPFDGGFGFEYSSSLGNYPFGYSSPKDFIWRRAYRIHAPFIAILDIYFPDGLFTIFNCASPVSEEQCVWFYPIQFDRSLGLGSDMDVNAFSQKVQMDDLAVVERQRPRYIDLTSDSEQSFGADLASTAYRKMLRNLGLVKA
ncbi:MULTISPECIES: Rieske 2Fe-2S domain-containing protein [unclassified Lysobacter]|uniref:Rieske 2Fe-2S domain-containing protein n=1 Tax=unclassified Lysobacter TaxID=2635362 RepID=UPI001BE77E8A|nr:MULTISPECIES: Rieske 2Fe-2S domain-containing protein [unclassified Lysobacter]MBT2748731.1 Rieske 2Fe-2S domain-containing protein [Lysobacter sp. ISL-42]MBT2751666.1 Rieske 2Fe-2S domain-containing protein [Lysobacter sp. ISL-50]MBT2775860.1 Rieske 2Fe-2S domain-containing protein [Lysobacter sp. ISL-54]MBT2782176.1 Rieske 2Fe-2S domain-containing protein [Lysobacter sp. ISL-52]